MPPWDRHSPRPASNRARRSQTSCPARLPAFWRVGHRQCWCGSIRRRGDAIPVCADRWRDLRWKVPESAVPLVQHRRRESAAMSPSLRRFCQLAAQPSGGPPDRSPQFRPSRHLPLPAAVQAGTAQRGASRVWRNLLFGNRVHAASEGKVAPTSIINAHDWQGFRSVAQRLSHQPGFRRWSQPKPLMVPPAGRSVQREHGMNRWASISFVSRINPRTGRQRCLRPSWRNATGRAYPPGS